MVTANAAGENCTRLRILRSLWDRRFVGEPPPADQARADSTRPPPPPLPCELRQAATSNPWILTAGANDGAKLLLLLYAGWWPWWVLRWSKIESSGAAAAAWGRWLSRKCGSWTSGLSALAGGDPPNISHLPSSSSSSSLLFPSLCLLVLLEERRKGGGPRMRSALQGCTWTLLGRGAHSTAASLPEFDAAADDDDSTNSLFIAPVGISSLSLSLSKDPRTTKNPSF